MKRLVLITLALALAATGAFAEEGDFTILNYGSDLSVIQYEDFTGMRANVAALRSRKGVVVVNTFLTPGATAVAHNMIADRFPEEILYLINTNPTMERNGGNQIFKKYIIVAHHEAREILEHVFAQTELQIRLKQEALDRLKEEIASREGDEQQGAIDTLRQRRKELENYLKITRGYEFTLPESGVYSDNSIDLFDKKVHIRMAPSSITAADLIVLFEEEKTVVCGDLVLNGSLPVWDMANGGSLRGMLDAMDQILGLEENYQRIVPGFGEPGGFELVINQKNYLLDLMSVVNSVQREGGSVDDVLTQLMAKYGTSEQKMLDLKAGIAQAWQELGEN